MSNLGSFTREWAQKPSKTITRRLLEVVYLLCLHLFGNNIGCGCKFELEGIPLGTEHPFSYFNHQ